VWFIDVDIMNIFGAGRREACHRLGPLWEGGVHRGDSGTTPHTTTCSEGEGLLHVVRIKMANTCTWT